MNLMQLYQVMDSLVKERDELRKAGLESQANVLDSKYYMAKSYTMDPAKFTPGNYRVEGEQVLFELQYLNGRMGWGKMGDQEEVSFPISKIKKVT
jgi:hypothetical protein